MALADAAALPTFEFAGARYFKRVTLIVDDAVITEALHPVFPPDQAARQALRRLEGERA